VEELADRPSDFKPLNVPDFKRLLPLSEIIATVLGADSPAIQAVWKVYNALIEGFGDEYKVLIDAPLEEMMKIVDVSFARAVVKVRNGAAKVIPGYDGVYGQLVLGEVAGDRSKPSAVAKVQQRSMSDFW
jgi:PHP family Zn ribbon phosphoesterase